MDIAELNLMYERLELLISQFSFLDKLQTGEIMELYKYMDKQKLAEITQSKK